MHVCRTQAQFKHLRMMQIVGCITQPLDSARIITSLCEARLPRCHWPCWSSMTECKCANCLRISISKCEFCRFLSPCWAIHFESNHRAAWAMPCV
jgi:hypothetical protein